MANAFKIAFDTGSDLYGDPRVNYYIFDAIMLTDGSNTQVIKTDFNPTKINTDGMFSWSNGQKLVEYTIPDEANSF